MSLEHVVNFNPGIKKRHKQSNRVRSKNNLGACNLTQHLAAYIFPKLCVCFSVLNISNTVKTKMVILDRKHVFLRDPNRIQTKRYKTWGALHY